MGNEIPESTKTQLAYEIKDRVFKWAKQWVIIPLVLFNILIIIFGVFGVMGGFVFIKNNLRHDIERRLDKAVDIATKDANDRINDELEGLLEKTEKRCRDYVDKKLESIVVREVQVGLDGGLKSLISRKEDVSTGVKSGLLKKSFVQFDAAEKARLELEIFRKRTLKLLRNNKINNNEKIKQIEQYKTFDTKDDRLE